MSQRLVTLFTLCLLALPLSALHAADKEGEKEAPKKALYLAIADKFVVNVQDGAKMRFMQVKVQVMTREEKVSAAIEGNLPAFSHAMIMLLSNQNADTMRSPQGREQVRMQALGELQQVLSEVAGISAGLEAVYFTDFVIQ
jgi:flagellar FliL protein